MQFLNTALTLLTLTSSVLAAPAIETSTLEARNNRNHGYRCLSKGAHIVANSGHGALNIRGYGFLESTVMAIKAAIPGSNNYSNPFDKQTEIIPVAVAGGVVNLTNHIAAYTTYCPDTPIILVGYSEGAIIMMNTLCGRSTAAGNSSQISPSYLNNIAAALAYADESRVPNQPYDFGTCTTGQGVNPRLNPSGCGVYEGIMRSWADENDPQSCITQAPEPDQNIHWNYQNVYDGAAAEFAAGQFQSWKMTHSRNLGGTNGAAAKMAWEAKTAANVVQWNAERPR